MFDTILQKFATPAPVRPVSQATQQVSIHTPTIVPTVAPISQSAQPITVVDSTVTLQSLDIHYELIQDPIRATEVITSLQGGPVGIDIETTPKQEYSHIDTAALSPHLSEIRTVQLFAGESTAYIIDVHHTGILCLQGLSNLETVAHNALFEMQHLHAIGVDMPQMHCTMLMYNAIYNVLSSLQDAVEFIFEMDISKVQQRSNWGIDTLSQEQLEYAALDAVFAYKLYQSLHTTLGEYEAEYLYPLLQGSLWAIKDMVYTGLRIDLTAHANLVGDLRRRLDELTIRVKEELGSTFNPQSAHQVEKWITENVPEKKRFRWPRTDTGALQTDRATLSKFSEWPGIALILEYRKYQKFVTSFGQNFVSHCNPRTGRIHPDFRIAGAKTGRMTCSRPSVQNFPREKAFRALFSAPEGRRMICADYSQMELRIVAILSADPNMLQVYSSGGDLHIQTAKAITGHDVITPEDRQCAKAANFGLVYGQGPNSFRKFAAQTYGVELSLPQARDIIDAFFAQYPVLKSWQQAQARSAEQNCLVQTIGGRTRSVDMRKSYTISMNHPVQGAAAEVLYAALGKLPGYLAGLDAHIVNCVHDEILLEAADQDAEKAKDALEQAMLEGFLQIFPNASTIGLVDAHIGQNWAEAKG